MTDEMKAKREKLFSGAKNGYDLVDQAALEAMDAYCETYKQYLDNGKTERECTDYTIQLAQAQGFVPYQRGMELKPGDKVYRSNRGKSVMLVKIGRQDLSHGAQIVASHIDSPRLDFKPHPLYEDTETSVFKNWTASWPTARPTITAASANTSGWPSPWSCGAWWSCGTAPR